MLVSKRKVKTQCFRSSQLQNKFVIFPLCVQFPTQMRKFDQQMRNAVAQAKNVKIPLSFCTNSGKLSLKLHSAISL